MSFYFHLQTWRTTSCQIIGHWMDLGSSQRRLNYISRLFADLHCMLHWWQYALSEVCPINHFSSQHTVHSKQYRQTETSSQCVIVTLPTLLQTFLNPVLYTLVICYTSLHTYSIVLTRSILFGIDPVNKRICTWPGLSRLGLVQSKKDSEMRLFVYWKKSSVVF